MTRHDWASKKVDLYIRKSGRWPVSPDAAARLLRNEHTRAVRVAKKVQRYGPDFKGGMQQCDGGEWINVRDILHKLKEGRT